MANEKKYLDFAALEYYDEKLKAWVGAADDTVLADAQKYAKDYADGLATNYDPAGTAATKVEELAEGQVKVNTDAIAKLNGGADEEGSVAKAVADSAATLNAAIEAVDGKADAAQAAADKAQGEVDAVELNMGDVEALNTESQTIVGAINEVLVAVGAGGTAAAVTMTTTTATEGALKSYTIKQGENVVGTIDIPKDMVVESGEVVTLADGDIEGYAAGTYIKLVLANVAEPLYINVGTLVDIYKAKENATQVQITIDSATREISAAIVAGSIGTTELADNSVLTAKIADANVTKAKLSTTVQASLDKADASAAQADFEAEVTRAKAAEAQALVDAKAYTDEKVGAEKTRAEEVENALKERLDAVEAELGDGEGSVTEQISTAKQEAIDAAVEAAAEDAATKANTAEENAKKHADDLNTDMDERVQALEAVDHDHDNMEVLNGITAEKVAAWDAAESNAKAHADGLNTTMDGRVTAVETKSANNESEIGAHADRLDALEGKVGNGFTPITNAEIDTLFT